MKPAANILLRFLPINLQTRSNFSRLADTNECEWFVPTPTVALLKDGLATSAYEQDAPDFDAIPQSIANPLATVAKDTSASTDNKPDSL